MSKKLKDIKEEILSTLFEKTQETFDHANRLISKYSPMVWGIVDKFVPQKESESTPTFDLSQFEDSDPSTQTEAAPAPSDQEEAPEKIEEEEEEVIELTEDEIREELENFSHKELEKLFRRNQILKIIYIAVRSGEEWLSAREISEYGETFEFKVRPSNIRKGINKKGHELNLISTRKRPKAKRNTKEHKVTPDGLDYLIEHFEL